MEPVRDAKKHYNEELEKRRKDSRAYTSYQHVGLEIADILNDWNHRALYIKLARDNDPDALIRLAKSVAERKSVANLGAYFMKLFSEEKIKKRRRKAE